MNLTKSLLFTFILSLIVSMPCEAVNSDKNKRNTKQEQLKARNHKKAAKAIKKQERKQEKLSKRLNRWMKRFSKKALKLEKKKNKRMIDGVQDESRFRLGLLLLGGGLLIAILARVAGLSFINWIAGIAAFVGLVLLILSFFDV
ncbi:MAG: DUF4337 family protein [Bacteroidota bacterium]